MGSSASPFQVPDDYQGDTDTWKPSEMRLSLSEDDIEPGEWEALEEATAEIDWEMVAQNYINQQDYQSAADVCREHGIDMMELDSG